MALPKSNAEVLAAVFGMAAAERQMDFQPEESVVEYLDHLEQTVAVALETETVTHIGDW